MTPATGQFTLRRQFQTPREELWTNLTDPQARAAWGAPSDDHVLHLETADLREDGHERHRCGPADAPEYTVDTRWYKLEKPDYAAFTETLTFGGARVSVSLVTYDLETDPEGTRLEVGITVVSFEGPEMIEEHKSGWTSALAQLQTRTAEKTGA